MPQQIIDIGDAPNDGTGDPLRQAFDKCNYNFTELYTIDGSGAVTLTAGAGLTGGGDLTANRTFTVGAGTGITVNFDDVALTVPVAVTSGGTGATTPAAALTNLGAASSASVAALPMNCGRFDYVSATALSFKPYNGDRIKINGAPYAIPAAGIAGLANTGVFVNGTAGQNLAASTVYWVFAFVNSGIVTGDFRTAATHTQSVTAGNEGTEILTGNDTRSLIGMVRTNASSQFQNDVANRFVISWFNRRGIGLTGTQTPSTTTTSGSLVELTTAARANFIKWAEEDIVVVCAGNCNNNTASTLNFANIGIDGTTIIFGANLTATSATASVYTVIGGGGLLSSLAEGFHFITPLGAVSGGTGTFGFFGAALLRG